MKLRMMRSRSKRNSESSSRAAEQNVDVGPDSPPSLVKELTATFRVFDRDADGKISKAELGSVLSSLGGDLSGSELDELITKVDGDGDGFIDLQEFITFHTRTGHHSEETILSAGATITSPAEEEYNALQAAFDVFDADRNGFISAEELQSVMCSLGDEHTSLEECRHMINCVDKDGDHMVNFTEFQCLMSESDSPTLSSAVQGHCTEIIPS